MTDRRSAVPFDPEYFARRASAGDGVTPVEIFRQIYETNHWSGRQSRSGPGASEDQTTRIREALPALCRTLGVRTILDIPCGDFNWMADVAFGEIDYIGADLLPELVATNSERYGREGRRFVTLDLTSSPLPAADLMLCRDCLVHLSFAEIDRALQNLRAADIRYLLTTTFPSQLHNVDIVTGDWRPLNLEHPPFSFPPPLRLINEECTECEGKFADKSLGLWRIAEVPGDSATLQPQHAVT